MRWGQREGGGEGVALGVEGGRAMGEGADGGWGRGGDWGGMELGGVRGSIEGW